MRSFSSSAASALAAAALLALVAGRGAQGLLLGQRGDGLAVVAGRGAQDGAQAHPIIDEEAFAKEWHKEWQTGDFPSWKKTQSKTWRNDAIKEDSQSDGKPSPGLGGTNVG